ncbi:cupredoxin domain-containing protein [Hypericibacter sp.]|uniref:cupredoxin domain-containing protein n=1 Tax=Hypericibacter sp. TaxID=2705401 RepID=UPI003D6CE4A1
MKRETLLMSIGGKMMTVPAPARMAAVMLILGLGLLAVPSAASAAGTVTIEIGNYSFVPAEVTVAPGTKVVWVNHDEMVHSVVSAAHLFGSTGMDTDDEYSFVFEKEGDYAYLCSLHPYMTGVVKVRQP